MRMYTAFRNNVNRSVRAVVLVVVVLLAGEAGALTTDVMQYGAAGDGTADNTTAFQQALDAAGNDGGGIVHVPTGHYYFSGTLRIPDAVTLQGTFRGMPTNRHDHYETLRGSVLLCTAGRGRPDSAPFVTLDGNMSVLEGVMVYYPEWSVDDIPPVPYPPCVYCATYNNSGVIHCCLVNPYEGLRFEGAGKHFVRHVSGYPAWRGYYADHIQDIARVENVHFWTFGVTHFRGNPYCEWINEHGTAFEFGRSDWAYVHNTFCFGYGVGYKFSESEHGATNGNFLGIGADCCDRGIVVEQSRSPGLAITNGEFVGRWGDGDSVCVEILPENRGRVSLVNCTFDGQLDRAVLQRSPHCQLTLSACNFPRWDYGARHAPAVELWAGMAALQGNHFGMDKVAVRVHQEVVSAVLTGNQARPGLWVENRAGTRTQMVANTTHDVTWTPQRLAHYRVDVGRPGDSRFLRNWHQQETVTEDGETFTKRWGGPQASVVLPVLPGRACTLRLNVFVAGHSRDAENGIYRQGVRLAALPVDHWEVIELPLPPQDDETVRLRLQAAPWQPSQVLGNRDYRWLTVGLRSIDVQHAGTHAGAFDANQTPALP